MSASEEVGHTRTIVRLERLHANAWPPLETIEQDGWLLRFAHGFTRRANSVLALEYGSHEQAERVSLAEAAYSARRMPAIFRISDGSPEGLDAFLEARGYAVEAPTSVQTIRLAGFASLAAARHVALADAASDEWLDAAIELTKVDPRHRPTLGGMLGSIVPPARFATLRDGPDIIGIGLGVLEAGHVGLSEIVVASARRGHGHGRALVEALLAWGARDGAHTGYLSVMRENNPALRLYAAIGFAESYGYWYRVQAGPRGSVSDPVALVRAGYDALGSRYLAWAESLEGSDHPDYLRQLVEQVPDHPDVLDLGCGPGSGATSVLADVGTVTGVDISGAQLAQARTRFPGARFIEADLRTVSFEPATFDAVVALFSLLHVPPDDLPGVLRSVARWLRPGGRFLATFAVGPNEAGVQDNWLGVPMYFTRRERADVISTCEDAGLRVERADARVQDEGDEGTPTFLWVIAAKR